MTQVVPGQGAYTLTVLYKVLDKIFLGFGTLQNIGVIHNSFHIKCHSNRIHCNVRIKLISNYKKS